MLDIDETIDAFRRGVLDIDCKRMVLAQHKEGGERYEGPGYIHQDRDGSLLFKIYATEKNAKPFRHLDSMLRVRAGMLQPNESLYELDVVGYDGTHWTASRINPSLHRDATDASLLVNGQVQSITANLNIPQSHHYLRLHFFEEYSVPLLQMSETERYGNRYHVLDRAEFETCSAKFQIRQHESSRDTIVELTAETVFPVAFDLRIQEALQYLTAKPAFWRARLQSHGRELHLELSAARRKSARTQFRPPISPGSSNFLKHGWRLFGTYLAYVTEKTHGTHWNPVAYHLYNACEATANSVDSWAVGISVAVEAVAGLIVFAGDDDNARELALYQDRVLTWLANQKDLSPDILKRAEGQLSAMNNKRPQDILYALADTGRVEKNYVDAWRYLRNRHVHPKLQDIEKPTPVDMQKLLDHIHKVEVLLRQLTFHLIGYEGPFTDYGARGTHDFPSKQYPLAVEIGSA